MWDCRRLKLSSMRTQCVHIVSEGYGRYWMLATFAICLGPHSLSIEMMFEGLAVIFVRRRLTLIDLAHFSEPAGAMLPPFPFTFSSSAGTDPPFLTCLATAYVFCRPPVLHSADMTVLGDPDYDARRCLKVQSVLPLYKFQAVRLIVRVPMYDVQ
jgi:hypothetical protein